MASTYAWHLQYWDLHHEMVSVKLYVVVKENSNRSSMNLVDVAEEEIHTSKDDNSRSS